MEPPRTATYQIVPDHVPPGRSHSTDTAVSRHSQTSRTCDGGYGDVSPSPLSSSADGELEEASTEMGIGAVNENAVESPDLDKPKMATEIFEGNEREEPPLSVQWNGLPWYRFLGDVLSICLAICFIVLAACIFILEGKQESEWSTRVIQATELAPSFWPVVFSGVVGNALKSYANWRVERGVPLRLLGSLTMANTVLSAYTLSVFNFLTIFLLAVWTFNPIGSQSSFRSVALRDQALMRRGTTYYRNHALEMLNTGLLGPNNTWGLTGPAAKVAYSSVLTTATSATQYCKGICAEYQELISRLGGQPAAGKQVATDPWGSPRIPRLKNVPGYDPSRPEQWLVVPWNESVQEYSSLIGRRNRGPQLNFIGNASFIITSSYTEVFGCEEWACGDESGALDRWFLVNYKSFAIKYDAGLDEHPYLNASEDFFSDVGQVNSTTGRGMFSLDFNTTLVGKIPNSTVFIGTIGESPCNKTCMTSCSIRTVYVDAKVFCDPGSNAANSQCRVDEIRHMPRPPKRGSHTIFDRGDLGADIALNTVLHFPTMERGDPSSDAATFSEIFIENPTTTFSRVARSGARWCTVPMDVFADRFSLLLNTFLDSTVDPVSVLGSELSSGNTDFASAVADMRLLGTAYNMTVPTPAVYVLDSTWMGIFFFSTILMFAAAVTGLIFRCYVVAPQVLGYVGSLTRDSPYFAHMQLGLSSTESGEELSRRHGKVRVGVFDVRSEDEVGKIAFAPAETGGRVRRRRWYSQDI